MLKIFKKIYKLKTLSMNIFRFSLNVLPKFINDLSILYWGLAFKPADIQRPAPLQ